LPRKLGLVTIGQSPRKDLVEDFLKILPQNIEIIEVGALDDFKNREEAELSISPGPGETLYISRLRDGAEVRISKEKLIPLMQSKISYLELAGVDIIGLLCSGEFPEFICKVPVIYPDKILKNVVASISFKGKSAILIPNKDQVSYAYNKWSTYLEDLEIFPISPYTSDIDDFIELGRVIHEKGFRLVVMDCMGYRMSHKNALKTHALDAIIITTRGVLGKVISEMF